MRIIVLTSHFCKGGAEKQMDFIARELAANGARVIHISISEQALPEGTPPANLKYISLGIQSFRSLALFVRAFRCFKRTKPDVILSCVPVCDLLALLWRRLTGCKWVMRESSTHIGTGEESSWSLRRQLGSFADAVVANNQGGYDYWNSKRRGKATYLIPNLMYPDTIRELADTPCHNEHSPKDPYFICIGRLGAEKNFEQAIQGFAKFSKTHPKHQLMIVGEGAKLEELKRLANESEVRSRIIFTGYLPNPIPLLKRAEALLLPSFYEGCPNVVQESIILNVRPLLSNIPGHRALFDDSIAIYYDLGDFDATAEAMQMIADEPNQPMEAEELIQDWSGTKNGTRYYQLLEQV